MLPTVGLLNARPRHVLCEGAPEPLPGSTGAWRHGGEVMAVDVLKQCRGGKNRWHGDTPCLRMRAHTVWGLPPAEQPVHKHWRGVGGRTVLNASYIISKKSIVYGIAKVKLIVVIKNRKNSNRRQLFRGAAEGATVGSYMYETTSFRYTRRSSPCHTSTSTV